MEHYADLLRLCQLMHEKNEIQNRRHYARKRALRFNAAISHRTNLWRRKDRARRYRDKGIDMDQPVLHKPSSISTKMLKMSHADLRIAWYEAHIADNQAKLEIAKFTKANRKEFHEILKRYGWVVDMDNTNGRYVGVRTPGAWESVQVTYPRAHASDHQYLVQGRDRIKELAMQAHATQDLEDALVSA